MPRIDGPSHADIARRGDEFADVCLSAVWHTLDDVTQRFNGAVTLDDLSSLKTTWHGYISGLRTHIGQAFMDAATQQRALQRDALIRILKKNDAVTSSLVAAAADTDERPFNIPLVANAAAEDILANATNRLTNVGDEVWANARTELLTGLQNGEGIPTLRDRVSGSADVSAERAELIARSEIANAMNSGALAQMQQVQVQGMTKEWIGTDDGRERPEHIQANGEKVVLDGTFSNGLEPGEDYNCRCTYGFDIPDEQEQEFVATGCGCDEPLLASVVASAGTTRTFAPHYVGPKARARIARQGARKSGSVVPTPAPDVVPPTPVKVVPPVQNALNLITRDEELTSPCACETAASSRWDITGGSSFTDIASHMGSMVDELTASDEAAFTRYHTSGFYRINRALREQGYDGLDTRVHFKGQLSDRHTVDRLDKVIAGSTSDADVVVQRGVKNGLDSFGTAWTNDSMVGAEVAADTYTSTTAARDTALHFATSLGGDKNVLMRVLVPKGSPIIGYGSRTAALDYEEEFVLGRGAKFRIVADHGFFDETFSYLDSPAQTVRVRHLDVELITSDSTDAAFASRDVYDAILRQAAEKIANAPIPSEAAIKKAQIELENARAGTGRAGGEARGGSAADRRKQRLNLFKEFGGEDRGYIVCHGCGMKIHWADPGTAENPHGYARFERGKIFVKCQGGGYQLLNLLPECFACNRSRNDKMIRLENGC